MRANLPKQHSIVIAKIERLSESGTWAYDPDILPTSSINNQQPRSEYILDWKIPHETAAYLYNIILQQKPARILELGTGVGYSALWIGSAASQHGGRLDTVDYFEPKAAIAKQFFTDANLTTTIHQYTERIHDYLVRTGTVHDNYNELPQYSFVFMDADKHNYLRYWKLLQPLLTTDYVIIVDNADNFGHRMSNFIEHCEQDSNLLCTHLPIGTGLYRIEPATQ